MDRPSYPDVRPAHERPVKFPVCTRDGAVTSARTVTRTLTRPTARVYGTAQTSHSRQNSIFFPERTFRANQGMEETL